MSIDDEIYVKQPTRFPPQGGYDQEPDEWPQDYGGAMRTLPAPSQQFAEAFEKPSPPAFTGDFVDLELGVGRYRGFPFPVTGTTLSKIKKLLSAAAIAHLKDLGDEET